MTFTINIDNLEFNVKLSNIDIYTLNTHHCDTK